jgi:ABC-type tungstate transport system permease subunit
VNRRTLLATLALSVPCALALGCGPDKPRALVVADGSGVAHNVDVDTRVKGFQQRTGRQVRVLIVEPAQAVTLASRGEADVAVVPMETSLDTFLASEHGRVHGQLVSHGERLRILEVDAKQHPKVDAKGARDLATALITPP